MPLIRVFLSPPFATPCLKTKDARNSHMSSATSNQALIPMTHRLFQCLQALPLDNGPLADQHTQPPWRQPGQNQHQWKKSHRRSWWHWSGLMSRCPPQMPSPSRWSLTQWQSSPGHLCSRPESAPGPCADAADVVDGPAAAESAAEPGSGILGAAGIASGLIHRLCDHTLHHHHQYRHRYARARGSGVQEGGSSCVVYEGEQVSSEFNLWFNTMVSNPAPGALPPWRQNSNHNRPSHHCLKTWNLQEDRTPGSGLVTT